MGKRYPPVLPLCSFVGRPREWLNCQALPAAAVISIALPPGLDYFSTNAGFSNRPFTMGAASSPNQSSSIVVYVLREVDSRRQVPVHEGLGPRLRVLPVHSAPDPRPDGEGYAPGAVVCA